jgi:hypothetical protein
MYGLTKSRWVFERTELLEAKEYSGIKSKDDFGIGCSQMKGQYDPQSYITNKRSTRLIQDADHFQIGTLMYTKDTESAKVSRTFIPIFPFLYNDLKSGRLIQGVELYLPKPPAKAIPLFE